MQGCVAECRISFGVLGVCGPMPQKATSPAAAGPGLKLRPLLLLAAGEAETGEGEADQGALRTYGYRRRPSIRMNRMDFTERTVIDGKPATVCYLDAARMPTTSDKAVMLEVRFDNGDTMFTVVKPKAPDPT